MWPRDNSMPMSETPPFGYLEWLTRNQNRGFDEVLFQLHRTRNFQTFWALWRIDAAWIHKTASNCEAHSQSIRIGCDRLSCIRMQYFLRVVCVMSETDRQFARRMLLNSNAIKDFKCWHHLDRLRPSVSVYNESNESHLSSVIDFTWILTFGTGVAAIDSKLRITLQCMAYWFAIVNHFWEYCIWMIAFWSLAATKL